MTAAPEVLAPEPPGGSAPPPTHGALYKGLRDFVENRTVRFVAVTVAVAAFGYYVPQWIWGWDMPAGVLMQGFIIGSLTALMAFGLALIYKSNRVINFAQADLGAVPASLAVSLIAVEAWSYWLAIPVALIAGVALGSVDRVRGDPSLRARAAAHRDGRDHRPRAVPRAASPS